MDTHIAELIKNRRFKEAHKALIKRLKKSPNDAVLLISQAEVLLASGETADCKTLCINLCTRKPPITDYDSLVSLFDIVCRLSITENSLPIPDIANFWSSAIQAARSKDRHVDLAEEWAAQSIKHEQWTLLAKAALMLQRQVPTDSNKRRLYWFWQITAYYLAGLAAKGAPGNVQSHHTERADGNQLDQRMAVSMLGKAVKSMPEDIRTEDSSQPGLWMVSSSELQLLCLAYRSFGCYQELGHVLADGKVQKLCAQDFRVQRAQKELYAWERLSLDQLWLWARNQLQFALDTNKSHLLDNWDYWGALLEGLSDQVVNGQASQPEALGMSKLNSTESIIRLACNNSLKLRGPSLAALKFSWRHARRAAGKMRKLHIDCGTSEVGMLSNVNVPSKIDIFTSYFKENCMHVFVVEDLAPFVPQLSLSEFTSLRKRISQTGAYTSSSQRNDESYQLKWLAAETNSITVDYIYIETQLRNNPKISRSKLVRLLESFACNCTRLYRVSLMHTIVLPSTSMEPGDGACILAARALITLSTITSNGAYRNQALCILSFLLSQSQHNFGGRLEYVTHALSAGLPSSAWDIFKDLDVKKILHEKISPWMLRSISTLQPFSSPQLNAYDVMRTGLKFYDQALLDIPDYQELALQYGNYSGMAEMQDLRQQLRRSPTRLMMIYESRRIARLTGVPYEYTDISVVNASFSLEPKSRSRADVLSLLPAPELRLTRDYLERLAATDAAMVLTMCGENEQQEQLKQKAEALRMLRVHANKAVAAESLEQFEQEALVICQYCVDVISYLSAGTDDGKTLRDILEQLQTSLGKCYSSSDMSHSSQQRGAHLVPPAIWYCKVWVTLELSQACHRLCSKVLGFIKRHWSSDQSSSKTFVITKALQVMTTERVRSVKEAARAVRLSIEQARKQGRLVEDMLDPTTDGYSAVIKLLGKENIDRIVIGFCESSQIALDSVGRFHIG